MITIRLVRDGVFPILQNAHGSDFPTSPETGLGISGTIQGEGKLAGIPVLFIRMANCNLRCAWVLPDGSISICDTPLSSFDTRQSNNYSIAAIVDTIMLNKENINHLVISGGEPFVQKLALKLLLQKLKAEFPFHITIETNASIYDEEVAEYIDFFSLSPKLLSSSPTPEKLNRISKPFPVAGNFELLHDKRRINLHAIQSFINHSRKYPYRKDFQLKFVFSSIDDEYEIKSILKDLNGIELSDVLLMPLGDKTSELKQTESFCLKACLKNGWRFSPRYHIELFGNKHGV